MRGRRDYGEGIEAKVISGGIAFTNGLYLAYDELVAEIDVLQIDF